MIDILTFDEETHAYTLGGRRVPSVTEIVAPVTAGKYADTNAAMLAQAQRRGSRVHEICEAIDCGVDPEELEIEPELVGYVNAYLAFLRDYSPQWEYIEKPVYTRDYAGRVDRIGLIDGKRTIVDLKTTGTMDRLSKLALLLQLYGYSRAWFYMDHTEAEQLWGLQLKKNGSYTIHRAESIARKYDFPATSALWSALLIIKQVTGGYEA